MSVPPDNSSPRDEPLFRRLADMEGQLDEVQKKIADSNRLASLGIIATVIAHEFNNLLTPIVSYSQYALRSAEGNDPDMNLIRKALQRAQQSAEKAGKICASMLSLARGESSDGTIHVRELVDEVLNVLARDPRKDGIALRVQIPSDLRVCGDAVQLEQVLLNLLINARHAMLGRGGSLTIKANTAGEWVRIQVIDTGPGIPEKIVERIFEPFFTTKTTNTGGGKSKTTGTGLGLSICKDIVERHKGRIEVHSRPGRGTTFNIFLPAVPPTISTAAAA